LTSALHLWAEMTRDEVARIAPRALTVLPVASIEQHGPHLPTVTDTALVDAVLDRACELLPDGTTILRAPTLCYGASDHHLAFGATLSLTSSTFEAVLRDLLRSLALAGCSRVLIVNGHGGNESICRVAAGDAAREHELVVATASYWQLEAPPEGIPFPGHAGQFETSMLLAAKEGLVRLDLARPSPGSSSSQLRGVQLNEPDLWTRIDGFTDDPTHASAEEGVVQIERFAKALAAVMAALSKPGSDTED
jgi:creatinine amidohydrolase